MGNTNNVGDSDGGSTSGAAGGLADARGSRTVTGDVVRITGVRAVGTHGVLDTEHAHPQPFEVDVALLLDTTEAARTDDVQHTVSYAEVAQVAASIVQGPHVDLVETLAARIADEVLARFTDRLESVDVTVHKPEAPVGLTFTDVSVTVHRSDERTAVVALGANLDDPARTLAGALRELRALPRTRVTAVSPLMETDPVGGPEQPAYLNAVTVLDTTLRPGTLLRALHAVEAMFGRVREVRWGARTLDLDLIQYGDPLRGADLRSDSPELTLPHPRAHERGFVLAPWAAADPAAALRLPGDDDHDPRSVRSVRELLREMSPAAGDEGQALPPGVRPGPEWPVLP